MDNLYKNKYRISSTRLQTWDYADNGMYFVTICTANRECSFGEIVEARCTTSLQNMHSFPPTGNKMLLNDLGKVVEEECLKTPSLRPDRNLTLAEYVVMPNHFHGIIHIDDNQYNTAKNDPLRRDAMHRVSTIQDDEFLVNPINVHKNKFGPQSKNLASIIRGFKSSVTSFARKNDIHFGWQERFHDHIINSREEYLRIADYIRSNPDKWQEDKFFVK